MQRTITRDPAVAPSKIRALAGFWEWLAVAAIVIVAFGLRVWAVRWGLPYVDHPDEPNPVTYALEMLKTGDLNPHVFRKPTLYVYLLLALYAVHYRWGLATGLYSTTLDEMVITTHRFTTVPEFFVWGRMLTVVVGSLVALGVYVLARRVWNRSAGLIAALFVATSPLLARHSQYVTFDVPSAAIVLLAFFGALAILERGRWRAYLLAGLCVGFAASTKYNAGVVALTVAAAHVLYWRRESLQRLVRLIAAGAMAVVGFLIGTPYALLAWPEFMAGLTQQRHDYASGSHGDVIGAWSVVAYAEWVWSSGLGPILTIAVVIGLLVLLRQRPNVGLLWLSFVLPYTLAHMGLATHFMRNLMPVIALCALPIGVAGASAITWLSLRAPRLPAIAPLAVVLLLFVSPAQTTVERTRFEARPHSKVRAAEFVRTLPRGQRIAVELNALQFTGDPVITPMRSVADQSAAWYRANKFRYLVVVLSNRSAETRAALEAIKAEATVLEVFEGDRGGYPGPRVEVLDLGTRPESLRIVPRRAQFGPALHLLGFESQPGPQRPATTPLGGTSQSTLRSGESLQLNLTWQTTEKLPHDYTLFVHVVNASGDKVAQRDALLRAEDYPTSQWQPGELVVDRADVPLPALPSGTYTVQIGVYHMETGERLPLAQPEPASDGSTFALMTLDVR